MRAPWTPAVPTMRGPRPRIEPGAAGFTLVELLAVLAILALLMGASFVMFGGGTEKANRAETRSRMAQLEMLISAYEQKHGDYPTDRLRDLKIKVDNDHNEGIEACLACLHGVDHPTGRLLDDKVLGNTDEDETTTLFHREGSTRLLEVVDAWGNPIAYIHHRNYDATHTYLLSIPEERDIPDLYVSAAESDLTGVWANAQSYQLISAGSDEEFGTEDDIANFEVD